MVANNGCKSTSFAFSQMGVVSKQLTQWYQESTLPGYGRIIYNRHQTGDGKKKSSLLPQGRDVGVFKADQGGRRDGDGWAQGGISPL